VVDTVPSESLTVDSLLAMVAQADETGTEESA
jgi:hypothetical protein